MTTQVRDVRFDLARSFACVGVVVLHTTGQFASSYGTIGECFASALHFMFRASVPLFFMASGYFQLTRYSGDARSYYYKRARRVWVPTLFWSACYVLLLTLDRIFRGESLELTALFRDWFYFGKPGAGYHLWFLYALFALDLLTPFVSRFISQSSRRLTFALSVLLYVIFGIITNYSLARGGRGASDLLVYALGVGYLSYFYWGYAFGRRFVARVTSRTLALASLVYVLSTLGMTLTSFTLGADYARNAFLPLCALQAFSVYTLALGAPLDNASRLRRCVERFAPLTFGVYLVHVAILPVLSRLFARVGIVESPTSAVALTLCALAAATVATLILRRVPYLRRLV